MKYIFEGKNCYVYSHFSPICQVANFPGGGGGNGYGGENGSITPAFIF